MAPVSEGRVRRRVTAVARRRPVVVLMLWFSTVGQLIAFVPVLSERSGTGLPPAPFVVLSTVVGLLLPALALAHVLEGPGGPAALLRRVAPERATARWWVLAVGVVPAVSVGIAVAALGPPGAVGAGSWAAAVLLGLCTQTLLGLVLVNLWEEVVWTGVVQQHLQVRHGPLRAAVLTAPLFALQHAALVVGGGALSTAVVLAAIVVLAVPFRALMSWSYARSGSLLVPGLVHAAGNAVAGDVGVGAGLLPRLYPDQTAGPLHLFALAVVGLGVVLGTRGRLGRTAPARAASEPARP